MDDDDFYGMFDAEAAQLHENKLLPLEQVKAEFDAEVRSVACDRVWVDADHAVRIWPRCMH